MKKIIRNLGGAAVSLVFTFSMTQNAMAAYNPADIQILREAIVGAMTGAISVVATNVPPVPVRDNYYDPYLHEGRDEAGRQERYERDFDERGHVRSDREYHPGFENHDAERSA